MRNAFSRFSFVLLILGFIASCSIKCIFIHTICVEMPIRPASWLGLETLVYEISWKDGRESIASPLSMKAMLFSSA